MFFNELLQTKDIILAQTLLSWQILCHIFNTDFYNRNNFPLEFQMAFCWYAVIM